MDSLTRSDSQDAIEVWLDESGLENAWEIAPALVDLSLGLADLEVIRERFHKDQLTTVLEWLYSEYTVFSMLTGIELGAERMSEMVKVLKSYSYLDQAPVQNVDIHKGLDDTLVILHSRIKNGINVSREYATDLPAIHAYGSELNQVWTNLLDNAIYALDGQGEIILRTRQDESWVVVEIEDNGAGIPVEVQPRIFDPFFTTKPPGDGSGLGLDISYNIVVNKHHGNIKFNSHPGKTCFEVWLPINLEQ
jgi:signal transduction histidine kinase